MILRLTSFHHVTSSISSRDDTNREALAQLLLAVRPHKMVTVINVPLKLLVPENVEGYGEVISSLEDVRPVVREGEMVKERMEMVRIGNELYFTNHAVGDDGIVATLVDSSARGSQVNYHGDATQAFIGADRKPTVFLLAKPTKNPCAEDFVAFYSNGSVGMSMLPDVWHTSPLPVEGNQVYENTQGNRSHHATVAHEFLDTGVVLEVPLRAPDNG